MAAPICLGLSLIFLTLSASIINLTSAEVDPDDDPMTEEQNFELDQLQHAGLTVAHKRANKPGTTSSFLRLGKASSSPGTSSFIRFGRSQSFLRLGRGAQPVMEEEDTADEAHGYLNPIRYHHQQEDQDQDPVSVYRRAPSSFIRFGKRSEDDAEAPHRGADGDEDDNDDDDEEEVTEVEKRRAGDRHSSSFLRLGRGSASSSFLRLGRANAEQYLMENYGRPRRNNVYYFTRLPAAKRLLARNFIRLGKRSADRVEPEDDESEPDEQQ